VIERSLDGSWQLRESGTAEWLDATVPGGVHLELMAAGRISDPFVADEELRVQWVAERDWEYRCEFTVDADVLAQQRSELVFDGLDTFAAIELNGEPLGRADNMFRSWRFDVTGRLRLGINEIATTSCPARRIFGRRRATSGGTGGRSCPTSGSGRACGCKRGAAPDSPTSA